MPYKSENGAESFVMELARAAEKYNLAVSLDASLALGSLSEREVLVLIVTKLRECLRENRVVDQNHVLVENLFEDVTARKIDSISALLNKLSDNPTLLQPAPISTSASDGGTFVTKRDGDGQDRRAQGQGRMKNEVLLPAKVAVVRIRRPKILLYRYCEMPKPQDRR